MAERKLRSLAEVTAIEDAYRLGVPSLGHAAAALLGRWRYPLRDAETLIRLVFLSWYQRTEPQHLTGLEEELPAPEELVEEAGGDSGLEAESQFVLGYLGWMMPWALGREDYWSRRAEELLAEACRRVPESDLFRCWRFFVGKERQLEALRLRVNDEIYARFAGRGALGDYMVHALTRSASEVYGRKDAS